MARVLALLALIAFPAFGETTSLQPVQDNTIYDPEVIDPDNPSVNFSNGVGDYIFAGRTSTGGKGKTRRALLKFDLSSLPSNAIITSASLRLYLSNTIRVPAVKTVDVELRRLRKDWGEGTSDAPVQEGGGATVTTGDASWFHNFFATETWETPGGDFEALPSGIEAVGDKFLFYSWEGPGLAEDVQSWIDEPAKNFGWIVISDESETETAKRFDSKDSFNFSSDNTPTKPQLTLEYTTDALPAPERLVNVSTRGFVGTGDDILIAGLVISGNSPRRVLVRGIGPTLLNFDVSNVLQQPLITIFRNTTVIASHDAWPAHQVAGIHEAGIRTGAFAIDSAAGDVAFITDLNPGSYSIHLRSSNNSEGNALLEAYDLDRNSKDTGRLVNISTRGFVGEEDSVMIAGFVIPPGPDRRLLIRGVGPELETYDVSGFLIDPKLDIVHNGSVIASNDDWSGDEVVQAAASVNAFPLKGDSKDAATVVTLSPGTYSAILSGVGGSTGVGLVEVYELP